MNKPNTNTTLDYYNKNSELFTQDTLDADFSAIPDIFLGYLQPGSLILDFGCGTGRDSKYFLDHGFCVEATDGSEEMVKIAKEHTGLPVRQMLFKELDEIEKYDGIFANASILHVPFSDLPSVLTKMRNAVKHNGIIYVSFKYGCTDKMRGDRFYTDMDEDRFGELLKSVEGISVLQQFVSGDVRPDRADEKWLNVFMKRD